MQHIRLVNDQMLWLLFAVVFVLVPVYIWNFISRKKALKKLADINLLSHINNQSSVSKQLFKALLLIFAFIAIVIALTQPGWNPKPQKMTRKGRDVVILLDTSRSMLAADLPPSRLERAKIAISDLMETLKGDKIGIITFAGSSTVKCPLTQDYAFARMILADITTESTIKGGTNIGDAIRDAADKLFDENERQYKDIILISDGGDQDTFPQQAAADAGKKGIRIIAVGLGNSDQGARIPIVDVDGNRTFLKYDGQEIWVKLEDKILQEVATATPGGRYIPVGTRDFDLGSLYEDMIADAEKRDVESTTMFRYDERFQVFVALALLLLISEVFVSERR